MKLQNGLKGLAVEGLQWCIAYMKESKETMENQEGINKTIDMLKAELVSGGVDVE